jgi:hypothetical protein
MRARYSVPLHGEKDGEVNSPLQAAEGAALKGRLNTRLGTSGRYSEPPPKRRMTMPVEAQ